MHVARTANEGAVQERQGNVGTPSSGALNIIATKVQPVQKGNVIREVPARWPTAPVKRMSSLALENVEAGLIISALSSTAITTGVPVTTCASLRWDANHVTSSTDANSSLPSTDANS